MTGKEKRLRKLQKQWQATATLFLRVNREGVKLQLKKGRTRTENNRLRVLRRKCTRLLAELKKIENRIKRSLKS